MIGRNETSEMAKRSSKRKSESPYTALDFYLEDYQKTLFPLRSNRILAGNGFSKLIKFARDQAKKDDEAEGASAFLSQRHVCGMKAGWHLRRTVKLDPVAEVFLYDLVFRNRGIFRKSISNVRECFGYRFSGGKPIDATQAYKGFKGAQNDHAANFKYGLSFDVASYFNSIYHHDLVSWFDERGAPDDDVALFGRFLREINAGRSVDCLPQGLYPSKMIGNDLLKFVDNSSRLRSSVLIRFMDDMALFSDSREDLFADFYLIQDLLGQKGLSINPSKTKILQGDQDDISKTINAVRKGLLKKRRILIVTDYDAEIEEREISRKLNRKEISLLKDMLAQPQLEEEDAELILSLMGSHSADVFARFDDLLREFPNLARVFMCFRETLKTQRLSQRYLSNT